MSVSANFNIFCNNLSVSEKKKSKISLRFDTICEKLNERYWNIKSTYGGMYTGSYGRRTANVWVNNIEMIFELPISMYNKYKEFKKNNYFEFLMDIKSTISEIYPHAKTKINTENYSIQIFFLDRMSIELLPVFRDNDKYIYADYSSEGSWKVIDPISEIKKMNIGNQFTDNNLQKLCKMAHAWRRHCNVPIKEILLDTLAYNFISQWIDKCCPYSRFDILCKEFFKYIKNQEPKNIWKALGSESIINNPENFIYKATVAYFNAESAMALEKEKKSWHARQKWNAVFGSKFPESMLLEKQLKKMFDKSMLLYHAQIKCVNIITRKRYKTVGIQLVLVILMFISLLIINESNTFNIGIVIFGISSLLFFYTINSKKFGLRIIKNKHRESAQQLLNIQEQYKNLIDDLNYNNVDISVILKRKISLQTKLINIYKGTSTFVNNKYLKTIEILDNKNELKEKSLKRTTRKIRFSMWQGYKFLLENRTISLMKYRN